MKSDVACCDWGRDMTKLGMGVMWVGSVLNVVYFLFVWGFFYEVLGLRQTSVLGFICCVLSFVLSMVCAIRTAEYIAREV